MSDYSFMLLCWHLIFGLSILSFFCSFYSYRSLIFWLILWRFSLVFWSILLSIFISIFGKRWRNIKIKLFIGLSFIWTFFFLLLVLSHWSSLIFSQCVFPSSCDNILFVPHCPFSEFIIRVFCSFLLFRRIFLLFFVSFLAHWLYRFFCVLFYRFTRLFSFLSLFSFLFTFFHFFTLFPLFPFLRIFCNLFLIFLTLCLFSWSLPLLLLPFKERHKFG